jgi:hypothetical protein
LSLGKGFDGGVCHLRSLGFLTFSIICYFEQNAVFQKWSVYIPVWKAKEAPDRYSALEVSTWRWKCPVSEMLLFYSIMQRLMLCFSRFPLKHWNEQSEVRLWVTVYYINVCFSLLSCLKLWHHEMKRYSQSHIRLKRKGYFCVLHLPLTVL